MPGTDLWMQHSLGECGKGVVELSATQGECLRGVPKWALPHGRLEVTVATATLQNDPNTISREKPPLCLGGEQCWDREVPGALTKLHQNTSDLVTAAVTCYLPTKGMEVAQTVCTFGRLGHPSRDLQC